MDARRLPVRCTVSRCLTPPGGKNEHLWLMILVYSIVIELEFTRNNYKRHTIYWTVNQNFNSLNCSVVINAGIYQQKTSCFRLQNFLAFSSRLIWNFGNLIVPTPLVRGELYTQMGFFVQAIFADRYIYPREMWVVSFKSSSSEEFKIKKIDIWFFSWRYRGLKFHVNTGYVVHFCSFLAQFLFELAFF